MKWTKDRCDELAKLRRLLVQVSSMNSGSGIVERIQECIKLANELYTNDLENGRAGFHQFLIELAIQDRKAKVASDKSGGTAK